MLYLIKVMAYRLGLMLFVTFCCLLCGSKCQQQLKNMTQEEVRAEVGGHVRLPCNHQIQGNVTFMYMQRRNPSAFVNGYHHLKKPQPHKAFINRTAVDRSLAWVDLWDVEVNDEGEYECVLKDETKETKMLTLFLKVSANYSAPVVTVSHSNESAGDRSCVVTCFSSGGYPNATVKWAFKPQVAETQWMEVNASCVQNTVTMLYSVSGSININCSQPLKITCTVEGAVSQQIEICNTSGLVSNDGMVITASVVTAVLFILVIIIMVNKQKACPATDPPDAEARIEHIAPNTHLMQGR